MNRVEFQDIWDELFGDEPQAVCQQRLEHIECLDAWLLGRKPNGPCYNQRDALRYAPSLISRSDAELYGLSLPRFAVRLYLNSDTGQPASFLNLRRADLFRRQTKGSSVELPQLVGDCVVKRPAWLPTSVYQVLADRYGAAYGEELSFDGTPFVQYVETTGACAHAVCFMASMVLRKYAKAIFGLPEIAALICKDKSRIDIDALSAGQMAAFFGHSAVGLRSIAQRVPSYRAEGAVSALEEYGVALHSYLMSNMPIVVSVDKNRLVGQGSEACPIKQKDSIYGRNRAGIVLPDDGSYASRPSPHCVLLVGCSLRKRMDHFIMHDPLWSPYLLVSAEQLNNSSCYLDGMDILRQFVYMPVTPGVVKMPLHLGVEGEACETRAGVRILAHEVQATKKSSISSAVLMPPAAELCSDNFRLMQLKDLTTIGEGRRWGLDLTLPMSVDVSNRLSSFVENQSESAKEHWIWVQRFSNSVWVWDAEILPPLWSDVRKGGLCLDDNLFAVITAGDLHILKQIPGGDQPLVSSVSTSGNIEERSTNVAEKSKISLPEISLITSFAIKGIESALENWPDPQRVKYAELYAFVQKDLKFLCTRAGIQLPGVDLTAVEMMARLVETAGHDEYNTIAAGIAELFNRKQVQIRSIATFIPELLDSDVRKSNQGCKALRFLLRLSSHLNNYGQNIGTIELVGGTLANDIQWLGKRSAGDNFITAGKRSHAHIHLALFNSLFELGHDLSDSPVRLAFEMEPGPLFVFNDIQPLVDLVKEFENWEARGLPENRLGINLDIGHMLIAGRSVGELPPRVQRRIVHAHISDHSKGHLSDAVVASVRSPEVFQSWLRFLQERLADSDGLKYSGLVSVELECACCKTCVEKSVDTVFDILSQM